MRFANKYEIGDLVEYFLEKNDDHSLFGFIKEVTFYKSDAVNFATSYLIERCNTAGQQFDEPIYEHNVKQKFGIEEKR